MAEPLPSFDDRAHDLAQQGKIREALDCYNEALKINPDNDVLLNNKAIALISLDKCAESLDFTKRAITINPGSVEGWINMGVALDKLGRHHEASEALEHAVELSPYHAYARALLGMVYQKMDMGDHAEVQNRKLQEIVFPNEYAGFYFTLSAFLLGTLLGGIRTVQVNSPEVSFSSQLIIFFLFCMICCLYWRSRKMWQEINRHVIMVPSAALVNADSPSSYRYLVLIIMIVVFVLGILMGGDVKTYL
ncbi:MAG: tetratricopeptide repeat protein [Methanoregula sp.]|nr:tetratricopeptide repeat protein [Methanoregula sp.]